MTDGRLNRDMHGNPRVAVNNTKTSAKQEHRPIQPCTACGKTPARLYRYPDREGVYCSQTCAG